MHAWGIQHGEVPINILSCLIAFGRIIQFRHYVHAFIHKRKYIQERNAFHADMTTTWC